MCAWAESRGDTRVACGFIKVRIMGSRTPQAPSLRPRSGEIGSYARGWSVVSCTRGWSVMSCTRGWSVVTRTGKPSQVCVAHRAGCGLGVVVALPRAVGIEHEAVGGDEASVRRASGGWEGALRGDSFGFALLAAARHLRRAEAQHTALPPGPTPRPAGCDSAVRSTAGGPPVGVDVGLGDVDGGGDRLDHLKRSRRSEE